MPVLVQGAVSRGVKPEFPGTERRGEGGEVRENTPYAAGDLVFFLACLFKASFGVNKPG